MKKLVLIEVIGFLFLLQSCSTFKTVYCTDSNGNKNPVMVLRDMNDVFPVYARDYKASIKATLDVLDIDADVSFGSEVKNLRETLEQEPALVETIIKAHYLGFVGDLCSPSTKVIYHSKLDLLSERVIELAALRKNLMNPPQIQVEQQPSLDSLGYIVNNPKAIINFESSQKAVIDNFLKNNNFLQKLQEK